jgi:hypothetical protein
MFVRQLIRRMMGLQKVFELSAILVLGGNLSPTASQIQQFSFGRRVGFNCRKPFRE